MRFLYLHGFASTPLSRKSRFFHDKLAELGHYLEIPALDRNDFEHLTLTSQLSVIESVLHGEPATLIGSSMGGYLAALYASTHPEISKLLLLAPAFGFAKRWREMTNPVEFNDWKNSGWRSVYHYGALAERRIHYELFEDSLRHPENPDFHQPAMIFHGTADVVVPIELSEHFVATHSNAKLIAVNSTHELTDVLDRIAEDALPFLLEP